MRYGLTGGVCVAVERGEWVVSGWRAEGGGSMMERCMCVCVRKSVCARICLNMDICIYRDIYGYIYMDMDMDRHKCMCM